MRQAYDYWQDQPGSYCVRNCIVVVALASAPSTSPGFQLSGLGSFGIISNGSTCVLITRPPPPPNRGHRRRRGESGGVHAEASLRRARSAQRDGTSRVTHAASHIKKSTFSNQHHGRRWCAVGMSNGGGSSIGVFRCVHSVWCACVRGAITFAARGEEAVTRTQTSTLSLTAVVGERRRHITDKVPRTPTHTTHRGETQPS